MKKIHRFFVTTPYPTTGEITISEKELVHQMYSVLKFKIDDVFALFWNGSPDVVIQIRSISKKELLGTILETKNNSTTPDKKITAILSITKGDTFDMTIQKLTEIGIDTIVPIVSDRTIKQKTNIDRLKKISTEALEQCGGNVLPTITEIKTLEQILKEYSITDMVVYDTYQDGDNQNNLKNKTIILIGPEGGWSEREQTLFREKGITIGSLGSRIYRAETAAIIAAYLQIW